MPGPQRAAARRHHRPRTGQQQRAGTHDCDHGLQQGKLAADDAAAVMAMAGDSADAAQAREIADLVNDPAMSGKVVGLMDALVKAASTRGITPAGAEAAVTAWLQSPRVEIVHRATILAGAWKVESAREALNTILTQPETLTPVREGAVQGLAKLGGVKSRDFFDQVFREKPELRVLAVQGLTEVGPQLAAKRAVEFFVNAKSAAEAEPIFSAFLKNKQLPGVLAKELSSKSIPDFIAVEAVRMVSTRGIKDNSSSTITTGYGGKFQEESTRKEFLAAIHSKQDY